MPVQSALKAVYLELVSDLTTELFMPFRFIARWGKQFSGVAMDQICGSFKTSQGTC